MIQRAVENTQDKKPKENTVLLISKELGIDRKIVDKVCRFPWVYARHDMKLLRDKIYIPFLFSLQLKTRIKQKLNEESKENNEAC